MQSGRMTASVDGEERTVGAGDTLVIPRGTPHKMWNPGTETATASRSGQRWPGLPSGWRCAPSA